MRIRCKQFEVAFHFENNYKTIYCLHDSLVIDNLIDAEILSPLPLKNAD